MRFLLVFIPVILFGATGITAQHRHSHDEVFAVTGKIDADERSGKIPAAFALKQKVLLLRDPSKMDSRYRPDENTVFKCMTPVIASLENAYKSGKMDLETTVLYKSNPVLPTTQAVYTSPSGKFEITYSLTGKDSVPPTDANLNNVPDYVEWTAFAADSSLRHMVNTLGYLTPILTNATYKIIFKEIGYYGITYPSGSTTRIEIHRNFLGFPDNTHPEGDQKGAVLATVGHELKHAVQYMYSGWEKDVSNYLEMDATLYEDVLFDDVNDYYNYLSSSSSIFRNPNASILNATYYHVTWALFFKEKYGDLFWRKVWDRIGAGFNPFFADLNDQVAAENGSLKSDMLQNQLFHIAVGDTFTLPSTARSLRNFGFEERLHYPVYSGAANLVQINSATSSVSSPVTINGLGARHIQVKPAATDTGNVYISLSYNKPNAGLGVVIHRKDGTSKMYLMPAQTGSSFSELRLPERWEATRRVFAAISNTDLETTSSSSPVNQVTITYEISNKTSIAVAGEQHKPVTAFELSQNFPNPFNPSTTLSFSVPAAQQVTLSVYDMNGRLVQRAFDGVAAAGKHSVSFDASNLASGIYLYRLTTPSGTLVKRMTLLK